MMKLMKNVRFVLNKEKFYLVATGQLKEVYVTLKAHWFKRLTDGEGKVNHYDAISFTCGISKDNIITFILKDFFLGYGDENCGAPEDDKVFIAVLGDRIA